MRRTAIPLNLALFVAVAFLPRICLASSVYAVTSDKEFGTLDLGSGQFTVIGSGLNGGTFKAGLALLDGVLYTGSVPDDNLDSINPATAVATTIGGGAVHQIGSTLTGLYTFDSSLDLVSIDPSTGDTTVIGSMGIPAGQPKTFSTDGSSLYLSNGPDFYSVDTTTGAASLIGSFGPNGPSDYMEAMTFVGGILYGETADPKYPQDLFTIDPGTGLATLDTAVSGVNANQAIYGMASSAAPEPGGAALITAGFAGLLLVRRSGRRA